MFSLQKCDFETLNLIKGEYVLNWTTISSDFLKHNVNVVLCKSADTVIDLMLW